MHNFLQLLARFLDLFRKRLGMLISAFHGSEQWNRLSQIGANGPGR